MPACRARKARRTHGRAVEGDGGHVDPEGEGQPDPLDLALGQPREVGHHGGGEAAADEHPRRRSRSSTSPTATAGPDGEGPGGQVVHEEVVVRDGRGPGCRRRGAWPPARRTTRSRTAPARARAAPRYRPTAAAGANVGSGRRRAAARRRSAPCRTTAGRPTTASTPAPIARSVDRRPVEVMAASSRNTIQAVSAA